MKTIKWMHTVYQHSPLGQRALNGNGRQCQDDAGKSLEAHYADRPKLSAHHLISEVHRLLQRGDYLCAYLPFSSSFFNWFSRHRDRLAC